MTKDEMQRYLNQQAQDGKSQDEAMRRLMEVLGLNYPSIDNKKKGDE
ncbi:MAG: hypothetical protein IJ682_11060 [Lachnospiraceae bacterium]|nr:hypothetical protein [Lachnospiraceae bacterium]